MRLSASFSLLLVLASTACGGASSDAFDDEGTSASSGTTGEPTTGSTTSVGSTTSDGASTSVASSGSGLGGDDTGSGAGGNSGAGGLGGAGEGGDASGTGGESAGTGGNGSGTGGESAGTGGNGSGGDGSGGDGGGPACVDTDFNATSEEATGFGTLIAYSGTRPAGGGLEDDLGISLLSVSGPGDYTIVDANLSDCDTCVLLRFECVPDTTDCDQKFLARAGTVRLESVEDDLIGELIDVELYEVTTSDGVSTPVPNGETRCIESYAFDTVLTGI